MPDKANKLNTAVGQIKPREITQEMRESYIDYAMSVIVARALPDVRDGLKPVHRRILYAMREMGLTHSAKYRKSATVVGECFVKDTLVLTSKGLVPIQDVDIGDRVYTQSGLKKVIQVYEMPARPLLRVSLDNGVSNIVTYSQKFKVLTEDWKFQWKEAEDLSANDYLLIKTEYPKIKKPASLRGIIDKQPGYFNEAIAYFLGLFISEGAISRDYSAKKLPRISIFNNDYKTIAVLAKILRQEFGYQPAIESRSYNFNGADGKAVVGTKYAIRVNRKEINDFFVSNFSIADKWALNKEIPSQIFISPEKVAFAFIGGLIDGDGSIHKKRNVIHYGSISEKLIQQLQVLLQHYGIFTHRYTDAALKSHYIGGRRVVKRHQFYYLEAKGENASRLASRIYLVNEEKRERAARLANKKFTSHERKGLNTYDLIPYAGKMLFQELSRNHIGSGWYRDDSGIKFRMGIKYPTGCKIRYSSNLQEKPLRRNQIVDWGIKEKLSRIKSPFFAFLSDIVENKIYFSRVAKIEPVSPEITYDLEVEDDHEFIANGVISHNCLGKYHPHGDQAVYDTLARMAQDFSLRYPLIDGQGNFGSIDGDPPAAMRYTEAKLSKVGEEMLKDIEKETVDFIDNYDGTRKEPTVLPSPLPQLLLNGSLGIAVGMATNIPPHNLTEVTDALLHLIDNPKADTEDLFKFIKGPDFPTAGSIFDKKEILAAYTQGKGPIVTRGKAEVIDGEKGKNQIIITEIPFQVQKSSLIEKFANLVQEKKIEGVKDIRDESDKEGMRIVLELAREAYPQKVLNRLYKFSDLQRTFHLNMLALVEGLQPKVLNLPELLTFFIEHRKEVVFRRTKYDLDKAKERAHILEGLAIALSKIDAVISTIKKSKDREDAKNNLIKKFKLTEIQVNAILEIRLQQLAKLERQKIEQELREILAKIKELTAILKSPQKIKDIVKKELISLKETFGGQRRTRVVAQKIGEIAEEDLVPLEETIITLTQGGYIKRINPKTYKIQKRGGKGIMGMKTLQDDIVEHFLSSQTHDNLFFFTDSGKVFKTPIYEIPEGQRVARGRGLLNFLEISPQDKILSLLALGKEDKDSGVKYLVMATSRGIIKKTALPAFDNVRRSGLIAITLKKGDLLRKVQKSTGSDEIILVTKKGQAVHFKEQNVREMGRQASGIRGIRLKPGDEVMGMEIVKTTNYKLQTTNYLLVVMENGYGKRTALDEYRLQSRGGSGIKTANITPKTGQIVFSRLLTGEEEDLIVISRKGQVIRTAVDTIPKLGRSTQGVRIMRLEPNDKVASATCI
ncbi:MAG: DNA gyrase subunit A [Parcubacteria group bacterium Gr01-1014_30]|nr:MAG: DNA gyrase subunit A [Parcubacteria group bacterium Gr01-1014_30]